MIKTYKSKYPLTTQSKKVLLIIRKNKLIPKELIKSYCESYFTQYAFIEHKNDIDPVTKTTISPHYHLVGNYYKDRTSFSTILNQLVKYFKFDNANGVQIDKYESYVKSIQYLIHKNNPEKTKHNEDEIIHNIPNDDFKLIIESQCDEIISFDFVYATCYSCLNIVDVIKTLGFKTYHKYRATILDMWKSIQDELKRDKTIL